MIYTEKQARKLPGLIEVISERRYTLSQAKARAAGGVPKDMTPGGKRIIVQAPWDDRLRRTRYQVMWHVANYKRG